MTRNPVTNLDSRKILIAPSILAANFAELGNEIARVEKAGADLIHVDIMDGHFVPNLTIGPPVVQALRNITKLPFDVHLMLTNPKSFVKPFADAGADSITFHVECSDNIEDTIREIRSFGCSAGLSLKPKTPADKLIPYLDKIDLVLVMTVEPGFGGQSFMSDMMPKTRAIRDAIIKLDRKIHLEVDGGIDGKSIFVVAEAGANMIVAGTSVFRAPEGAAEAIRKLKSAQDKLR
ncbi:MAG TPA: ribulose-phosphate 3-epimerase [Lentisphaeria bacterium]|nr:MAG: ribulose-phosphate 3-epimerase [Lentisphaerae bacterium GWF2_50_93]HCE44661.1 ribulose-phosphate 3-epimerase [Lentisphaeria bacterium]